MEAVEQARLTAPKRSAQGLLAAVTGDFLISRETNNPVRTARWKSWLQNCVWRRLLRETDGQALLLTAICLPVLLSVAGLVIDVGYLEYATYRLHIAAESAVLASVLEVNNCRGQSNCATMLQAATSAAAEQGKSASTTSSQCGAASSTGVTLVVNNPPCASAGDPNSGKSTFVEVVMFEQVPLHFMRVLGVSSMRISTRAEAAPAGNPNCIYALDPSGSGAISIDALATLNASCGVVDESSSANAFQCSLLSNVNVSQIRISGGLQNLFCSVNPLPRVGARLPNPADPLAYLPTPSVLACGSSHSSPYIGSSSPLIIASTVTLYPDAAYCGGITILPGANVTFMPGTYVLRPGGLGGLQGGLSVNMGARVLGTGVTFYNVGPAGSITFLAPSLTPATVSLTAPTSGTYSGILFFQDPQNSSPATLIGSSSWNTTLEGAAYFPSATVTQALSGAAKYNILVAKDIRFAAVALSFGTLTDSRFGNNYSSLAKGSPLSNSGAVLVQ